LARKTSKSGTTSTDPVAEEPVVTAEVIEDAEVISEPIEESVPEQAQEAVPDEPTPPQDTVQEPQQEPKRANSFVPLVLGGVVAAGLGYGAAYLTFPKDDGSTAAALTQQAQEIAELKQAIDDLTAQPDGTAELDALGATLTGRLDALKREQGMAISVLENRMNALERAPAADGSLPQTAIDAFQADIAALREEVAAQQSRIEDSAATAAAQIEQTRATAEALEQSAVQSTKAATVRVALARIQAALESGAPYDLDLPELQSAIGQSLDPALTGPAADGVPTLAALQKEYPKSARAALATARREGVSGEDPGTFGGFVRNLLSVRSVEPREGTSVDAILSRAEAALSQGRLTDTLAEIESLPEVVRSEFTGWTALAQTRVNALSAAETLLQSVTDK
jgi:hypothetical protein